MDNAERHTVMAQLPTRMREAGLALPETATSPKSD